MGRRVLIVGGVAGGSSCATRLRRLAEDAEIVVFERGPHVSFANCGLPYHVGGVIPDESSLLLVSPATFRERFDIEVRTLTEVTSIDREARAVTVRDLASGEETIEGYDALVLATGAAPVKLPVPGLDLPGVFELRTVPDTRRVREWIAGRDAKAAVVVGAGFVGLELAENLRHRGLEVHVVELQDHVLPPLDAEMAEPVAQELRDHGVHLHLSTALRAVEADGERLRVVLGDRSIAADMVLLGVGVKPRIELARAAGLAIGPTGGIAVDERMQTSDPHIWAVGDVTEDTSVVTGGPMLMPLAGPANRQGRLAADAICGREVSFRGVQGTAVCGVFDLTVATTGMSAAALRRSGLDFESVTLHPKDHVGYYPGAHSIHLKLLFAPDGRILGAQAVGEAGVEKRIDVIAMALQLGGTVYDLEQAELCYAPQYGAAKDPVNMAGMVAANTLRGDLPLAHWEDLDRSGSVLLDVRSASERAALSVPGSVHIPLDELRDRLGELDAGRPIWVYCASGKRSYDAARALMQSGFDAKTLAGGIETWRQLGGEH